MQPRLGYQSLAEIADTVIRGGLLRAVFQPIVDLRSGAVTGIECLSRPMGAAEGVSPGELFSEKLDRSRRIELEHLARRQSITTAGMIRRPGQLVFLNCSPQVIVERGMVDALLREVAQAEHLTPSEIVIEITEGGDVDEVALASAAHRLQDAGFQIALDDVGAGGNGLGRVSRIQPDWVKLDRQLISGINADADRRKLIEFLTRLAREIGALVVAEGIETIEELAAVVRLGISHGQGYGLGKPSARPGETKHQIVEVLRGAGVAREIVSRLHPLTGLPDRVECERRMEALRKSDASWADEIAVVDLRDLHLINARSGYAQGDRAITALGRGLSEVGFGRIRFVGHAGDDRFLLLGDAEQLESVIEEVGTALADQGLAMARGILFPGLLEQMGDPSDVFHLHSAVKTRADERLEPGRAMITIPMSPEASAA